jgi:uridine kinase
VYVFQNSQGMAVQGGVRRVVAIAAPIGGGKSALLNSLALALGETHTLCFDDYENATRMSGEEMDLWLAQGAVFDALEAPGLMEDLSTLRAGGSVMNRLSGKTLSCNQYVLFEMPLGRAWSVTAPSIDVLIWVDIDLDVALARRVGEITLNLQKQNPAQMQAGLAWLHDYMATYIKTIHSVLDTQRRVVRPGADLVLDGTRTISVNVQHVLQYLGTGT